MLTFSDDTKKLGPSAKRQLLVLVDTNSKHRLTDLHLSKLIMTVLTFTGVSKFACVNPAIANFLKPHTGIFTLPT